MTNNRLRKWLLLLALGLFFLGWLIRPISASSSPLNPLEKAWERIRAAGVYEFSAEAEQTLLPRPLPTMIGQTDQRVDMYIEGEVSLPDQTRLSLRLEGAGLDSTPVALVQEGGTTYLLREGEKIPVENPAALTSPTGDYLSYLTAAEDIQPCTSDDAPFEEAVACYTYTINGRRFAEHVRKQMQAQFRATAAAGIQLDLSPTLMHISGDGQVWLDKNDLPLRQMVNLSIVEVSASYDARVRMVVDYDFDARAVQQATRPVKPAIFSLTVLVDGVQEVLPDFLSVFLSSLFASALVGLRHRRWMQTLVTVSVSLLMLVTPLLQGIVYARVYDRFYERQNQAAGGVEALIEALALPSDSAAPDLAGTSPQEAAVTPLISQSSQPTDYCGAGNPGGDRDGDGLTDAAEYCLGTDPNDKDSDADLIFDGVEARGFKISETMTQTWPSNPLNPDSNGDGLVDTREWPQSDVTGAGGAATSWDPDGDGVPNVWDDDDDDDGVADGRDLSPFARTAYTDTFSFDITGRFDGYLYVDIQVQPTTTVTFPHRLRYGVTPLDWPEDKEGQIQDRDKSTDDLRLIPMLEVTTTLTPGHELAKKYGITLFEDQDQDATYTRMYIPLGQVGDGGRVEAFYAHVAYGPDVLKELGSAGLRWSGARMVWMVQGNVDEEQGNDGRITTKTIPLHVYAGPAFRVTGWQVTKSRDFYSAILGTPGHPGDDRQLFQALLGLSSTFLIQQQPDLREIKNRFSGVNTPIEQTWGVTATVEVDLPTDPDPHRDAGMAALNDRVKSFLSTHYTGDGYNVVLIAIEEKTGSYNLDALDKFEPGARFALNLNHIQLSTQRTLQMDMRDGWKALNGSDFALAVIDRTSAAVDDALDDLSDQYPALTAADLLALTVSLYVTWEDGRKRILSLDGQTLAEQSRSDQAVYEQLYLDPKNRYDDPENIKTLPGYLVEVGRFARKGSGLVFADGSRQIWSYLQANAQEASSLGFTAGTAAFFDKANAATMTALQGATRLGDKKDSIAADDSFFSSDEYSFSKSGVITFMYTADFADGFAGALKGKALLKQFGSFYSPPSSFATATFGLEIGLIWGALIISGDMSSQAIAQAVAATLFSTALFVISLNPVGAVLVTVFGVVDYIVSLAGGPSFSGAVVEAISEFFFPQTHEYEVTVIDDYGFELDYGKPKDPNLGFVVGNRFQLATVFTGTVKVTEFGLTHTHNITNSYIFGEYGVKPSTSTKSTVIKEDKKYGPYYGRDYCTRQDGPDGKTNVCSNTVTIEVKLEKAMQNVELAFKPLIRAQLFILKCTGDGFQDCLSSGKYAMLDEKLDEKWDYKSIYIDVLPKTVDEFWRWTVPVNHDPDGDGMSTQDEISARLGSAAYKVFQDSLQPAVSKFKLTHLDQLLAAWDEYETQSELTTFCNSHSDWAYLCDGNNAPFWLNWDSDGDGLSDKFEFDQNGALGTDAAKSDTDGDGLSDGLEHRLGTRVDEPDSDLDGLPDDQEVFHRDENGQWIGGWTLTVPEIAVGPWGHYTTTLPVFSDPRTPDTDGDGLTDAAEKANGTSPTAYDRAPRITLHGEPLATSPSGVGAVYVKAGDPITLTARVEAFQPFSVSTTLALTMPWHLLAAAQFDSMHGDRTPANTGQPDKPRWSFANNPLLSGESAYTDITAQTAFLAHSMTGTVGLRLPLDVVGWRPLGTGAGSDVYLAHVFALAADSGNSLLYAGGQFDTAGGRPANYIARWDGNRWATLDSGMNNPVRAIVVAANGDVYAAGAFTRAGGVTANRVARWRDGRWSALGDGLNDTAYALAIASDGDLYVAGSFSRAGNVVVNGVARWDGSSWSALNSGLDDIASSWGSSIAIDANDNVYVGGHFYSVSGVSTSHIAKWDGGSWSAMDGIYGGGGFYGSVKAIAIDPDSGQVYAGGDFYQVNGQPSRSGVVRWNGANWETLPDVADDPDASYQKCYALAFDSDGRLYAGGWWAEDSADDKHLARWDGDSGVWSSIGAPVDAWVTAVYALTLGERGMYVGGIFDRVDEVSATNVALYVYQEGRVQKDAVTVVVDAENPRQGMVNPRSGELIGGGVSAYVIGGYSSDETTWVTRLDVDLPLAGTATLTRSQSLSPWAYTWELPVDGVYTLRSHATDFVGHVSTDAVVEVMVDNTPPTVTVDLADGGVYGPPQDGDVITITLNGAASDNYSGLTRVQISTDEGPWREVWTSESATLTDTTYVTFTNNFDNLPVAATWDAVWTLPNVASVQGYHSLRVRAFDEAGNWPQILERSIIIDVIPPTDELVNRAYLYYWPHLSAGAPFTLTGVANDVGNVPAPSRPAELVGALDSMDDATLWLGLSSLAENNGGVYVAWVGDFNGDRRGDLAVGLPAAAGGAGRVTLVYGRAGDWPVPTELEMLAGSAAAVDAPSFVGIAGAGVGEHLLPAGDVNGDGLADLLVGDPANKRVFLIFGQSYRLGCDLSLDGPQATERVVLVAPLGEQIGAHLGAAGDVNGDGFDDLLIGATGTSDKAYLLLGQQMPWWETVPLDSLAAAQIFGAGDAALFGAGDLDGDFCDEFAVGQSNALYLFAGKAIYTPQVGQSLSLGQAVMTYASADARPQAAALGDVNGDFLEDLIYSDGGAQHVLLGDVDLTSTWVTRTINYSYGSGFLAAPGDVNDDGLNDVLIGGGGNAYLILGSESGLGSEQATISGVAAAASAPYAAGADLNSDGSSDLLLVPTTTDGAASGDAPADRTPTLDPMWMPQLQKQNLSTYAGSATLPAYPGADFYVNDDGDCKGQSPCYGTIQAAVDAASAGDLIIVQPGVYAPFTVNGKNNLTVRGMNPDAVFVDAGGSGFAAHITNANGVRLEQMTLRNASYGVQLTDAGVGGHDDAYLSRRTILDHLLVYDVNSYGVYMDRSSTLNVTYSTLVNTGNHVGVNMSDSPDPTVTTGWQSEPDTPDALYDGGGLVVYSDTLFYCTGNGARNCKWRDFPSSWFTPWPPANPLEANSVIAADSDGLFHVLGAPSWKDAYFSGLSSTGTEFAKGGNGVVYVEYASGSTGPRMWNGSGWSEIPGLSSYIDCYNFAAHPVNGNLYCLSFGGSKMSVWDGSSWTVRELDNSVGWNVEMAVDSNDTAHVVGDFSLMYGTMTEPCYAYAQLSASSTSWVCGGGDFSDADWVSDIAINSSNQVFVGGRFDLDWGSQNLASMNGGSINGVVSWSGATPIHDIEIGEDGTVYVTGDFTATLDYNGNVDQAVRSGVAAYKDGSWTVYPPIYADAGLYDSNGYGIAETGGGELYAVGFWTNGPDDEWTEFIYWNTVTSQWEKLGTTDDSYYGHGTRIYNVAATGQGVFVSGDFVEIDRPSDTFTTQDLFVLQHSHEVYSTTANAWTSNLIGAPMSLGDGAGMTGDANGNLTLLVGGGRPDSFRYNIAAGTWTRMSDMPVPVNGSAMTLGSNGYVYALVDGGTNFYRTSGYSWSVVDGGTIPSGAGSVSDGASLAYDPKNNVYYAFLGGNSDSFLRYRDGSWEQLTDRSTPQPIKPGAGLVFIPGSGDDENTLYAVEGSYSGAPNNGFWRYPLPEPNKIGFENSAIVVPAASSSANWLNLSDPMPEDFNFRAGTSSLWFNGSGQPNNGHSLPTSSANPFLDQSRDLYRMGQSGYGVGYHTYTAPITATTGSGIQAAINSGANRVVVEPGIYEEALYLVNGVQVIGSNPDWTVIRQPSGGNDPLVRVEGPLGATLSRFTLDGEKSGADGLVVDGNAKHITFTRGLVYDTHTAILIDGAESDLEVSNVTLAQDVNGLQATNCAPVDVRNSILVYNSGVGLSHQSCASTQLHTYNLFWANGSDFGADADAGAAELFLDPNFVDWADHDYRTLNYSPVIDAGNPTDPAPPSAGNRADIGYLEQGRASTYVDDDYCEICLNDGLTWGVDAFDSIQDALDAAQATLTILNPAVEAVPQLVVGLNSGSYDEQVRVPSHVLLMGAGVEETTINAGGSGVAVTFDGVTDAGVRDLTLTNAGTAISLTGASNGILVARNVVRDNATGVALGGRATARINFNTLVNNSGAAISASGPGAWASVTNNVLSGNGTGLRASASGQIFGSYNLLNNSTDYDGVAQGENDLAGQNPQFAGGLYPYRLTAASPALDAASPAASVPDGGGTRADLGYSELLAAPLSLLLGQEDLSTVMGNSGVGGVVYGVVPVSDTTQPVTATLPSSWLTVTLPVTGTTYVLWQAAYTPSVEGLHRFYSRASDVVGNQEQDDLDWYDGSFVADSTPPTLTWLSPLSGTLVAPLELRAQVSDYAAGRFSVEEKDVYFVIDGQTYPATWATEPWDEETGAPRVFRAWVTPTVGLHDPLIAYAEDLAGNVVSATVSLSVSSIAAADTTPPGLTVIAPADGAWVSSTLVLSGTASDGGSGLASVEVSVDGGATYRPATLSGNDWTLTWRGPEGQSFVSFPTWVRAADRAGNASTATLRFTIDEVPPTGLSPVTFNVPEGSHFDVAPTLVMTWNTPIDGSGVVTSLLVVDQITNTIPVTPVAGLVATRTLDANGEWYVHLGAVDGAGNRLIQHYGPWYVGINEGLAFGQRRQSIIVDGFLDLANGEWRVDREFLDDDQRPINSEVTFSPNEAQSFYTTWSGDRFYMAWQGAWWRLDGTLWVYLNTGSGGSDQLIAPLASALPATLPFAANYAVQITDPLTGTLWQYSGGWITSTEEWAFAQGASGDTEISLPLFGTTDVETLAYAQGDDGNVWAIFPATNPLNPAPGGAVAHTRAHGSARPRAFIPTPQSGPGGWQSYHWDDITVVTDVAANQPRATSLALSMDSAQSPQAMWGPGNTLQYVVHLDNQEAYTLTGQKIAFIAIPSTGVIHDAIQGASCTTTNPWLCTLDDLPPGSSIVTLTVHLASDLSGISEVAMYAILQDNSVPPELQAQATIVHLTDNEAPTTTVSNQPFVRLGSQTFSGTADDGAGVGTDFVEVRPEGGNWQRVEGSGFWSADLTVSPFLQHGDVWQLDVRAIDLYGQASAAQQVTFTVDLQGPNLTLAAPGALGGAFNEVTGSVSDVPDSSAVYSVAVKLDDEPWREALVFTPDAAGVQQYLWTWDMPTEDGAFHTLQVQATDLVGNVGSLAAPQQVWVDNVAPVLTVTHALTQVVVQDYRPGKSGGAPVLSGTVSDGGGVDAVAVRIEWPNGERYQGIATLAGQNWHYVPELTLVGVYRLQATSIDQLSNTTQSTAYTLTVIAAPDTQGNQFTTPEETPIAFEPLLDDLDLDGDSLYLVAIGSPGHGTATLSGTTWIVYTPTLDFNGADVFTYTASDGALTDTTTVTVTVTPVNDAPVITEGASVTVAMSEDGAPAPFDLTLNADDVDGDLLSWNITQVARHGTATISHTLGLSHTGAVIAYTPAVNYYGPDDFVVRVADGGLLSDTIAVSVTVSPVNDAPVAQDDVAVVLRQGSGDVSIIVSGGSGALDVLDNDSDVEGDVLYIAAVGVPDQGGSLFWLGGSLVVYTPTATFTGTETFTYTVSDGGLRDIATVRMTVINGVGGAGDGDIFVVPGTGVSDTITVTVEIPPDVVGGGEQFALVYGEAGRPENPPQGFKFAGLAFTLDAYVDGVWTHPFTFTPSLTLTIAYSDADVAHIGQGDKELALFYQDGEEWRVDGITIVERDLVQNRLLLTIAHLTEFALFGWDNFYVYLPLVLRP